MRPKTPNDPTTSTLAFCFGFFLAQISEVCEGKVGLPACLLSIGPVAGSDLRFFKKWSRALVGCTHNGEKLRIMTGCRVVGVAGAAATRVATAIRGRVIVDVFTLGYSWNNDFFCSVPGHRRGGQRKCSGPRR